MIKHLFKLIWNQKRKNAGLLFELFFSFLVLFAVLTFIIYNMSRYNEPLGFNYNNVWQLNLSWNAMEKEQQLATQALFKEQLKNYPEIEKFSFANRNTPYGSSMHINSASYGERRASPHTFIVDENYQNLYEMTLTEGKWYSEADMAAGVRPVLINEILKAELFGDEPVLGKEFQAMGEEPGKVIGVFENFKYEGEFSEATAQMFLSPEEGHIFSTILLRIKAGTGANFEEKLLKDLTQQAKGLTATILYVDDNRKSKLMEVWLPMIIFLVISGFLIFNVALGLFGVLWQNINIRKAEIGVRRAIGATQGNIGRQFIGEVLVLSTLAIILGTFFAIQFPLLGVLGMPSWVYLAAIAAAILVIYLLVAICAFFPSRQAAQLHPAIALHEE
ncbi:MAG: ABC transporter permease [Saprospiraceae bacterium]|nr:ABC transporter permease [Saprospiraceae bacterium]